MTTQLFNTLASAKATSDTSKAQTGLIPKHLLEIMGDDLTAALFDDSVCEIMLNPDGRLFTEYKDGKICELKRMTSQNAHTFCLTVASLFTEGFSHNKPLVSCALDFTNARFEAVLPPLSAEATFCIRRHMRSSPDLTGLISNGMLSSEQNKFLQGILKARRSLIVCGETGAGKTTLLCALLQSLKNLFPYERIISIEDTAEISCDLRNFVPLFTSEHCKADELVRASLRLRPDRIVMGEIRGAEALDMLDAFTTGHHGSMATLHAGNPSQALNRLCLLISRHPRAPSRIESMVGNSLDLLLQLEAKPSRHLAAIYEVKGYEHNEFLISKLCI